MKVMQIMNLMKASQIAKVKSSLVSIREAATTENLSPPLNWDKAQTQMFYKPLQVSDLTSPSSGGT